MGADRVYSMQMPRGDNPVPRMPRDDRPREMPRDDRPGGAPGRRVPNEQPQHSPSDDETPPAGRPPARRTSGA